MKELTQQRGDGKMEEPTIAIMPTIQIVEAIFKMLL